MRQQRSEAFRKFKKLLAEMRANLIAAGVDAAKIDKLDVDKAPKEEVIAAKMTVLLGLKASPEYRAFCRIWIERSPQWWANMALLGQTDGVEHRVLKKTSIALRQAFKTAYRTRTQKDTPHPYAPVPTTPVTYVDENGVESATDPDLVETGTEAALEPEEADAEARA